MAAQPVTEAAQVGSILVIAVNDVTIGKRLRAVDPVWARALGQIMKREGQRTEIEVCRLPGRSDWHLVAGAHRLTGAREVGIHYISAKVVENDPNERLAREISENLWRRALDPVERAAFIAEQVALFKQRAGIDPSADGRAASINVRWQKALKDEALDTNDTMSLEYGWSSEVGDRLGLSTRTIERDLLLYRRLDPATLYQLRSCDEGAGHPILKNASQLRALAKLDDSEQTSVVGLLIGGNAKSVSDALATLRQKVKPSRDAKLLSAFIGSFQRMGLVEKRAALDELRGMLTPGMSGLADIPQGKAERALRESMILLGMLLDEAAVVTDTMMQSAYDACEEALTGARR